ncbi:Cytochrome P450 9e2, partial [Harpegnathos saltator]
FATKFTMEYWTILLSILIGVLGIYYLYKKFHYFKRHNVIHITPTPIFGCMTPFIFRQMSIGDFSEKLYTFNPDAKYIGIYAMTQPVILFRDPELIKEIFIKNFEAFPNRLGFSFIHDPLFSKNLFSLQGQKWKDVRTLLSPAFTSSKIKTMFTLMSECAIDFTKSLSEMSANKSDMDMKDAFTKYTNDVIASCAFGIKVNSISDPTNKFYVYGKEAINFQGLRAYKFFFFSTFPWLTRLLGLKFLSDEVGHFFRNIIKSTIHTRDTENITRPDMIQLMMDIRGKRESERELSIEDMTAQAFIFFLGGFETSSTAMSFIAQEITANPDVQANLQKEIDKTLQDSNGEVTYEVINRLEYLDAVINEVLRLYPPIAFLERLCEKDYELPPSLPNEKPFTLKKGMAVWVPVYSLQRDEKYYDVPEKFNPERSLGNNSLCYIPFGLGPRMCIANRFAMLEIKVLIFHLLARYELKPSSKSIFPIKLSKNSNITMTPEGGFWLSVQR